MKALIWFLTIMIVSMISYFIGEAIGGHGFLSAVICNAPIFIIAPYLCKKWDENKKDDEKKPEDNSEQMANITPCKPVSEKDIYNEFLGEKSNENFLDTQNIISNNNQHHSDSDAPKKQERANTSADLQSSNGEKSTSNKNYIETNMSIFYANCVSAFHKEANSFNVANKDVIFIPELIAAAQNIIIEFLKDNSYVASFNGDAVKYYYNILRLSIEAGMTCARKWHIEYPELNEYITKIRIANLTEETEFIFNELFLNEIPVSRREDFYKTIHKKWEEILEPYWMLLDPRQYILSAMVAGYQLGVSMVLEKYGF